MERPETLHLTFRQDAVSPQLVDFRLCFLGEIV